MNHKTDQFITTIPELRQLISWAQKQTCREKCGKLLNCKAKCEKEKAVKQMNLIEAALGIPKNWWANQHMVLVVFDGDEIKKDKYKLRMPSGKENNANPLWIAGGFLPDGFHTRGDGKAPLKEALVDGLPLSEAKFYSIYTYDDTTETFKWEDDDTEWTPPTEEENIETENVEVLKIAEIAETGIEEVKDESYKRASMSFKTKGDLARSEYYDFYGM